MASRISKFDNVGYEPVSDEEEPSLSRPSPEALHQSSWALCTSIRYILYAITACFLVLGGVFIGSHRYIPTQDDTSLRIFKYVHFEASPSKFNATFFPHGQYSGPPSPERDDAWGHFADAGNPLMPDYPPLISISESDAQRSTGYSLDTAVRVNSPTSDRYLASLEIFHQLHCLNYVRKFIYFDHYKEADPKWAGAESLREHANHCVDLLRQTLMCQSDTGLVTYHWIKGFLAPVPDFSTPHMCRDPEDVLTWTKEHEVPLTQRVMRDGPVAELPELF